MTPGPWKKSNVIGADDWSFIEIRDPINYPYNSLIAYVWVAHPDDPDLRDLSEVIEHANLISSAPEMYELLKQITDEDMLTEFANKIRLYPNEPVLNILTGVFPDIEKVIAKAEGREVDGDQA